MKKTVKKVLVMLLVVCMALPIFVTPISAEILEGKANYASGGNHKFTWSFDSDTGVLTINSTVSSGQNGFSQGDKDTRGWGNNIMSDGTAIPSRVETAVVTGHFTVISSAAFRGHTNLKSITLPEGMAILVQSACFQSCNSLTEIRVAGDAYIPDAVDFSRAVNDPGSANDYKYGGTLSNKSPFNKYGTYSVKTLILNDIYNDEHPLGDTMDNLEKLETIMGPYDNTYLRNYASNKSLKYIPYGKINADGSTAWTYDEATKTVTIYGNGEGCALEDALSDDVVEFLNGETEYNSTPAENLIIRNDVTSIADGALAGLTNLKTVEYEGILKGDGISVRYEDYNGLRNLYSFNNAFNTKSFGDFDLVECGAMLVSAAKLGTSSLEIDTTTLKPAINGEAADYAVERAVWNANGQVGKVLSYNDETDEIKFAITLTNFTANWDSAVYSRAYAVYSDGTTNFVVYADNGTISLYDAMVSGCQQGVLNDLVCDNVAVWNVLATGKVADIDAGEGIQAMVINGKTDADAKVLVVRMANGELADDISIAAAKTAAEKAGYMLNDAIIALDFLA